MTNANMMLLQFARGGDVAGMADELKTGANIECTDQLEGETPLIIAASYGRTAAVQFLLEQGANINFVSQSNMTALYLAAWHGHLNVVKLLIEAGANVDHKGPQNTTALDRVEEEIQYNISIHNTNLVEKHYGSYSEEQFHENKIKAYQEISSLLSIELDRILNARMAP